MCLFTVSMISLMFVPLLWNVLGVQRGMSSFSACTCVEEYSHVTSPCPFPSKSSSKLNIVSMVTVTLIGRVGQKPILPVIINIIQGNFDRHSDGHFDLTCEQTLAPCTIHITLSVKVHLATLHHQPIRNQRKIFILFVHDRKKCRFILHNTIGPAYITTTKALFTHNEIQPDIFT